MRKAQALRPDVIVMDINMPNASGIDATRKLAHLVPDAAVLILTMFDDDGSVSRPCAPEPSAMYKGADPEDIIRAIASVAAGHAIFGPDVARGATASRRRLKARSFAQHGRQPHLERFQQAAGRQPPRSNRHGP